MGQIFDCLREAESLAQVLDDRQRLGRISVYMTEYFRLMSDLDHAIESGQRALALATPPGTSACRSVANFLGTVYYDRVTTVER